jgi:hypothetical protein
VAVDFDVVLAVILSMSASGLPIRLNKLVFSESKVDLDIDVKENKHKCGKNTRLMTK